MMFLYPQVFFFLIFLIPIIFITYFIEKKKQEKLNLFISNKVINKLSLTKKNRDLKIIYGIKSLTFLALLIALARPVGNQIKTEVENNGRDIIIAIDISNSMRAKDVTISGDYSDNNTSEDLTNLSRLEATKKVISKLLQKKENDRFSIIAFSDIAFPLLPFTEDNELLESYLNNLDFNYTSFGGTDISKAIEVGIKRLKTKDSKNGSIMIIFSDGEEHSHKSEILAKKSKEYKLKIITIGVGTIEGKKIPMGQDPMGNTYYQTHHGQEVITKLNDDSLKKIASITGGKYILLDNSDIVSNISNEIGKINKKVYKTSDYYEYEEWFFIFVFLSILLFMLPIFRRST